MGPTRHLPHFRPSDGIAVFLADLRAWSFPSQVKAARAFGLTHSTISRYESGRLLPPVAYLATLAHLLAGHIRQDPDIPPHAWGSLLTNLNQALRHCYPDQHMLGGWADVEREATAYLGRLTAPPSAQGFTPAPAPPSARPHIPDAQAFYGRTRELAILARATLDEGCRLINLVGIGGVGKSALAARFAAMYSERFEAVRWYTMSTALPPDDLLAELLSDLGVAEVSVVPGRFDQRITLLLRALQARRVLLVLDTFENVLAAHTSAGHYREGYEGYALVLQQLSRVGHQSCVLLIARERPIEVAALELPNGSVRTIEVGGLCPADARQLLDELDVRGAPEAREALIVRYSGNALALRLVAGAIRELFANDAELFLRTSEIIFDEIGATLAAQFFRLAEIEQRVLLWLAIERAPKPARLLYEHLRSAASRRAVLGALSSLCRRSLLERNGGEVSLQQIVLEYLTAQIVDGRVDDLLGASEQLLRTPTLLVPHASELPVGLRPGSPA
jgi:hypothetical protein